MRTYRPAELASQWGVSERRLRQIAREIGACSVIGKTMIITEEQAAAILDATKPQPRAPALYASPAVTLPAGGYDALIRLREAAKGRRRSKGG